MVRNAPRWHLIALLLAALAMAQQKRPATPADRLDGIPAGRTRVVDLSYAINDELPAWPGDEHPF